jgi:tRNA (guanine-N7-)-methyltransferase
MIAPMHEASLKSRSIRSYVIRAGRMTTAQRRALADYWPRYGVDFQPAPLDLDQLFGRTAPRSVEVGFGNGEHLLERALAQPERDFLGLEVHPPGVGHLLLATAEAGASNVRIIAHDAVEVLQSQISLQSLDEVQLLFPDPWPKKRHHKRRLVQPQFVALVATRLRAGGRFHLATDWEPYAEEMLTVLGACELLANCSTGGGYSDAVVARSATRFERRGARLGHRVRELLFRRRLPA